MELTAAGPADEATLLAHYDLYVGELVAAGATYHRDADGVWQPDYLSYWMAPGADRQVWILHQAVRRVGFAFVFNAASPHIAPDLDFCLSEIFVTPGDRNRGIGAAAARMLFDRQRGRWRLSEIAGNHGAIRFWRRLLADYTGGAFTETLDPDGGPVHRFDNRIKRL